MHALVIAAIWISTASLAPARAEDTFVVAPQTVSDQKAVFATVESRRVVPARARIGGTVAELAVKEGDHVELGQVVAAVGDEKIALQMKSLDAQIAGLQAQLAQAQTDLSRTEDLVAKGTISANAPGRRTHRLQRRRQRHAGTGRRTLGRCATIGRGQRAGACRRSCPQGAADDRHRRPGGRIRCRHRRAGLRIAAARAGAACAFSQGRRCDPP